MQKEGIDFIETFAPVVRGQSIRCLMSIPAYYGLKLEQLDVVLLSSIMMPRKISTFGFYKVLKYLMNSIKENLLYVY
jgi:hypothetical protein